jgi:hypothetical protein
MRFLFAGWFSATAGRHYNVKLPCGKREASFLPQNPPRPRSRPQKTQPILDYENENDDEDETAPCGIANAAFVRHTIHPDEQTVLYHHRD